VLCCLVEVEALRQAYLPSKESYQLWKRFIISEVTLKWNRSQCLIHIAEEENMSVWTGFICFSAGTKALVNTIIHFLVP
jgi:hypothetical protein